MCLVLLIVFIIVLMLIFGCKSNESFSGKSKYELDAYCYPLGRGRYYCPSSLPDRPPYHQCIPRHSPTPEGVTDSMLQKFY